MTACGPNPIPTLFCCSLWAHNGSYIFKRLGKKAKNNILWHEKIIWNCPWIKFSCTQSCSFVYELPMTAFALPVERVTRCDRDHWPAKPWIFTIWPCQKQFAIPCTACYFWPWHLIYAFISYLCAQTFMLEWERQRGRRHPSPLPVIAVLP